MIDYALAQAESAIGRQRHATTTPIPAAKQKRMQALNAIAPRLNLPGYELVREIHRGGQGVVFEAVQQSTARTVAIKVTRAWPVQTPADRARFEREVQLLAQLKHPNIVTIHDSGSDNDCDYFVMDYIDGTHLDRYIEERRLTHRETLALFARICHAVNVAHLRGVIHRDLKPGNVRVDQAGEPHILDFGLAKTLNADDFAQTPTTTGQFVGSLPWASPEQAEGRLDQLDLRTDVYSLGVMLYQLLTGRFPYAVNGSLREATANIVNAEPDDPRRHAPDLDDDAATIVLKCLRKAREERYETAGEVARDIDRYLRNEPIEARRDSVTYVLRKHLARHKITAGVAALFVLVVTIGLIASLWFWSAAATARDSERQERLRAETSAKRAQKEADKSKDAIKFIIDMLVASDPEMRSGPKATIETVLSSATTKLDKGALADHPLVEAEVRHAMGLISHRLGLKEAALEHAARAMELRRAGGAEPAEMAGTLNLLGMIARAAGSLDDAEKHYREALDVMDKAGVSAGAPEADVLSSLGVLLHQKGKHEEALPILERALEVDRARREPGDGALGVSLNNLALVLRDLGRRERAAACWNEALDIFSKAYGGTENLRVAAVIESLGGLRLDAGDLEGAEADQRQANAIREHVLGKDHAHVAVGLSNLGAILQRRGDFAGAEATHRSALEMRRRILEKDHPSIAMSLSNLGLAIMEQGRYEEVEPLYEEGLAIRRAKLGPDHVSTLQLESNLAGARRRAGRGVEAEQLAASVVERAGTSLPAGHRMAARFRAEWGACLRAVGRTDDAERELLKAHTEATGVTLPDAGLVEDISRELVKLYEAAGRTQDAEKWRGERVRSGEPGRVAP